MRTQSIQSLLVLSSLLLVALTGTAQAADDGAVADGIRTIKNVPYVPGANAGRQLDLYLPELSADTPPLVILIHGGGWNAGDKGDFGGACREFVKRGYAAASLNYRFSSEAIFPAPALDCKAAVRWLRANAGTYHFDPARIVVGGHSAGGHLAAFLGATNGLKAFDVGGNLSQSSAVEAVIWLAGVCDLVTRVEMPGYEGEQAPGSGESLLIGGAVLENRAKALKASPISYVNRKSAPFIFFHGDSDTVVPFAQAAEMYGR